MTRITRLLVANRGEIARRVFRTAREMGIATVAVYAEPDRDAPFAREATQAVSLGGTTAAETYLSIPKLIDAAERSGADAIHPGYGFLSENASFAQAVIDAGLTWVGPSPEVIASMGDKLAAKALLAKAGVPMLPGLDLTGISIEEASAFAEQAGYPVLVKASGGGGGRGMRVVTEPSQLEASIAEAAREAAAAFGNDTVFIEKYVQPARHIEVQILGDTHGNLIHCFERECSIQRRHQKVIEEAPSSSLDPALRERICEAALVVGREIGYTNAGTVEFLLAPDGQFYFLEVNTRIQVEHPVTEAITGLDLVREQIQIAMGEPISVSQADLTIRGHAIEARLYAEDPEQNFLPAAGRVLLWDPPRTPGLRIESAVETGSEISVHFDPLLAKFIAHAPTRTEGAAALANALATTRVHGATTNRDFLVNTLRHPAFLAGDTTTSFIETHKPGRTREIEETDLRVALAAASLSEGATGTSPFHVGRPLLWQDSAFTPMTTYRHRLGESSVHHVALRDGSYDLTVDGVHTSACATIDGDNVWLETEEARESVRIFRNADNIFVQDRFGEIVLTELPRFPDAKGVEQAGGYLAPMPGKVIEVVAKVGDAVTRGQHLLTLEAMKMEHRIVAATDGVIRSLNVVPGQQVEAGAVLLELEPSEVPKQ